ncbi:MAG: DNA cytosine methyltransferase [Candidatus Limiplasma sp.]|nr:DNA cytosine methyltransferase [Candidatus Limiplasma sp.]
MKERPTLGSLFDGIGGFPLAGLKAGISPKWAAEIEPFPIRVTTKRLPEMKHYGDIHALRGDLLEPVDIVTFGSPCQDFSIAGKRSGLEGVRSSLFFEAVRIIREMGEKTDGSYPQWVVWENVPGALSSSGGEDFREVLQSLASIKEPGADVPMPEDGKWLPAGEIMGDGYSLAWRILDAAKGWGVAQRRRRVFVVLDLGGQRAGQVLFESEGLSGYTPPPVQKGEGAAGDASRGAGTASWPGRVIAFEPGAAKRLGGHAWFEEAGTLRADMGDNQTAVAIELPQPSYCLTVGGFGDVSTEEAPTLMARNFKDPPVIGKPEPPPPNYRVRRLTPVECARLQGFPDDWCGKLETPEPSEQEIQQWVGIFEEWRLAVGKSARPRSRKQIVQWLRDPCTDAAEYKAYGNSVAVPCVFFVLAGIVWALSTKPDAVTES